MNFHRDFFGIPYRDSIRVALENYVEKENLLIQVSGCDMDKLIELFAAGYTLKPPDYKDMTAIMRDLV